MLGAIIGGIGSALGGLFGGSKKQTTTSEVDYVKMARNATRAGFNPLTALRNGGSAGFTTTTSPSVSTLPDALSNLGGVLGQSLGDKLDPIQAKKRELDTALVDAQLRELKQGPQLPGRMYPAREYTGTKVSTQLAPRLGLSTSQKSASVPAAYKPLNPNLKAGDDPEASGLGLDNGRYGIINPGFIPDAGGPLSQIFGEPGEWVGGILKAPEVAGYSLYKNGRSFLEDADASFKRRKPKEYQSKPYRWVGPSTWRGISDFFGGGWKPHGKPLRVRR
ncbi:DNA pilot protein [Flyfo microvirus Tbat2_83]|nr:DNA pilot protein [Flyfo microvirus Tbat2_83]